MGEPGTRSRRGGTQRDRRFRRRRALALLIVASLAAAIGGLLATDKEREPSSVEETTDAHQDAKRAARIEQLQQQLAEARKAKAAAVPPTQPQTSRDSSSFSSFASRLPGEVGLAYVPIGSGGQVISLGELQSGAAWSTIKIALAARVIADAGGSGKLSSSQRSLISSALRASDNDAAMELWNELTQRYGGPAAAARAVSRTLAAAGDGGTTVSSVGRDGFSPYGQTDWSLAGQARFIGTLAAGCVPGSSYLLDEMSQVVPSQRWGLGGADSPAFKGGWGPDRDGRYLVRQVGLLKHQGQTFVVAIAAIPDDGAFASGQRLLTQLGDWALRNLRPGGSSGC
jgi:hypothetical protein